MRKFMQLIAVEPDAHKAKNTIVGTVHIPV